MKKMMLLFLTSIVSFQLNAMEVLSDSDLQQVEGQAGADLSLKLSLNQNVLTNVQLNDGTKPTFNCDPAKIQFCRLAISPNKRFVKPTTDTANYPSGYMPDDTSGNRLWLVMKGVQGTMNIQKLSLDGTDLVIGNVIKPAIQLGFLSSMPIQIRNFGFNALSIEQDGFVSTQTSKNVLTEPTGQSTYGYLNTGTYTAVPAKTGTVASGATTANLYDVGKEKGFMGMQMNGNLALQGQMMMFSCDSSHPRCL
ncbi:hypothetical protein BEN71_14910 [Acinetobacter wuhouensis]|uniref:hypothetical protein n=1 Tax=Acinetobacter wuhouensis TaxID=1879050 RepID=UPI00083AD12F|nr:hypothetical protein [Acinetobacter wuhouensis]AXQ23281.1 hypothetical protein BEN71_14910 [Acinetobacter wuhouensis]